MLSELGLVHCDLPIEMGFTWKQDTPHIKTFFVQLDIHDT